MYTSESTRWRTADAPIEQGARRWDLDSIVGRLRDGSTTGRRS